MSNAYQMGQILMENETVHGEAVNTFATLNMPIIGAVDCTGLKQDRIDSQRVQPYKNGGTQWFKGPMGGSVKTKVYIAGHGSSTAGATTLSALATLLGLAIGGAVVSAATGTTSSSGTASAPVTVASATFAAGSLCKIGTLGDGRGNGQFAAIASHVGTALNLLTAIDAAPSAADVVYSADNIYTLELPTSAAVQPIRLQLLTANLVYNCHGCYAMGCTITGTGAGGFLVAEIEWGVSWFAETAAVTFPNTAVPTALMQGGTNAGGSLFVNDVGTSTRGAANKRTSRDFTITFKLGVEKLESSCGGFNQFQTCVGARRVPDDIRVSWTEDADAQTATPVLTGYADGTTAKHILATFSTANGSSVAFYFPNVNVSERPVQMKDGNGNINRLRFTGEANTGPTATTDLTASAMRIALA
jgi:hypothetical protein